MHTSSFLTNTNIKEENFASLSKVSNVNTERRLFMSDNKTKNTYDDGNIPEIDLPQNCHREQSGSAPSVEPLPESTRPRKDGPGGE